ncbi:hypothetical protein ACFXP7_13290 [Microbacterium sp. P06]|uniref:hypothetical protein n=1 Tax=unclassified Microbacterium TaxID=2609290 RepID=UPI0037457596
MSYATVEQITEHGSARISLRIGAPFTELRARIEAELPEIEPSDLEAVANGSVPWDDFLRGLSWEAPHGFVRLPNLDLGRMLRFAGREGGAVEYLAMDWAAAGRIHRLEPTALLSLPARLLLVERDAEVLLSFAQPSAELASFGLNKLAQAGRELDRRLGDLLEALDIARPSVLRR